MDHKSWLWRKKSSEKTIFATNKVDNCLPRTEEVLKNPINNGVGPEQFAKTTLNEKLASVLLDCPVKEDLAIKHHEEKTLTHTPLSQERRSEEKTEALKQSDKQQSIEEEEEQGKKIQEAVTIAHRKLEEKYAEASKQLADLNAENANMAKALLAKEKLIADLRRSKSEAESEFGALMMARLDSTEKENAFLRYEYNVVERELRIRNEEMEYYRKSADTLQKKVAGLEQECQRLHRGPAARKRLTGPPPGRRKSNPSRDLVVREAEIESSSFALERLRVVEEENEALKKALSRKIPELRSSKPGFDKQIVRRNRGSSDFDLGSDDAISSSGSWVTNNINNAVVSEFEYLRNGKRRDFPSRKAADISLMDDFVEMEKLATVSSADKPFDWLHVVLSAMLEQKHVSKRSLEELLEDIQIALGFINSPVTPKEADPPPISGYLTWSSMSTDTSPKENVERGIIQCSSLSESIGKIVKLIRDQKLTSATSGDYFIRVFQWRNSELSDVLQRFVRTCDDLSSGGSNLEGFAEEVASTLDWILNNYVTPKEGLSARDKIKKHFGWNKTETENEELGWPPIALENSQPALEEENRRLRDELKSVMSEKADTEARLNSAIGKSEDLLINIQELRLRVGRLQEELDSVKETKLAMEDQIVNEKMISDDLETQLTVAKAKLSELLRKVSSLEVELEEKRNCCEELEAACLELQLQLESDGGKETPKNKADLEEKQSQSEWEITSASEKLAECQETIVSLGKQLKALANPREAAILDKVSLKEDKSLNKRSSLRDWMMADDGAKALIAQRVKETASAQSDGHDAPAVEICRSSSCRSGTALAIVASKRKGGGFDLLRKLLLRRKRSNGQKPRVRKV